MGNYKEQYKKKLGNYDKIRAQLLITEFSYSPFLQYEPMSALAARMQVWQGEVWGHVWKVWGT